MAPENSVNPAESFVITETKFVASDTVAPPSEGLIILNSVVTLALILSAQEPSPSCDVDINCASESVPEAKKEPTPNATRKLKDV